MKKILPVILLIAAIAAGVFLLNRKPPGDTQPKPGRAAELAPDGAMLFVEIPDVARSLKRWDETSIAKIGQEPEWKEFSSKFGEFVLAGPASGQSKPFFEVLALMKEADPVSFFAAVVDPDAPEPVVVGGLPYRGKISAVKTAIEKLRSIIMTGASAPKSEIVKFEGTDIEVITAQTSTFVFAYRDNWFFFASALEPMKAMLQRYTKAAGAPKGLTADAAYAKAAAQTLPDGELTLFFNMKKAMASAPIGEIFPFPTKYIPQSILYSLKMEGPMMRDRLYFHMPEGAKVPALRNPLIAFTSENSYLYGALSFAGWEEATKEMFREIEKKDTSGDIAKALSPKGLKLEDILVAFGPELSLHSDWMPGMAYPEVFLAAEVRDLEKARKFAELIVGGVGEMGKISNKEEDGTTFWTLSAGLGVAQPTLAINAKHMVLGWSYTSTVAALKQLKTAAPGIAQTPTYQAAIKTVPTPTSGIFYVDAKMLFERAYEQYKPLLAGAMSSNPEVMKYADPAKLPKTATIAKHLLPTTIVYADAPEGFTMESTGTLAYFPYFIPMAGFGAFFAVRSPGPAVPPPAVGGGAASAPPAVTPAPAPTTPPATPQ